MNPEHELTNEELIAAHEEQLAQMSPEEREATLAVDDAMDRLMVVKLGRMYDANIELIPGDRHHIKVDGVTMGYVEFGRWLAAKEEARLEAMGEDSEEGDEEPRPRFGFFEA